jgi:uncharacterized membrane protein YkvA (DUF1232 family)
MRHPAPTPADTRLPLLPARALHRRRNAGPVHLDAIDIDAFNLLVHSLYPDAPHVDADAVASMARWLAAQPAAQRSSLLRSRLGRLAELETMRRDTAWPLEPAQARCIDAILDYVAREDDLIPDTVPVFGNLDDALLLELAWPMLAEDVDDYRDFCRFRDDVGETLGRPVNQSDWMRTRAEEGALWEHMHRVHAQAYVEHAAPASMFHVR